MDNDYITGQEAMNKMIPTGQLPIGKTNLNFPYFECPFSLQEQIENWGVDEKTSLKELEAWATMAFSHLSHSKGILLKFNTPSKVLTVETLKKLAPVLGKMMGTLLVQNEAGDKVISVYDRDRLGSMHQGARYHQTREGGTIHTDNVNVPETWEYLLLGCLNPSEVGGENILVNGLAVHQELKEKFPRALSVLEKDFYWEMRGVADKLYQAPIITYGENGEPIFRHLRPYMEAAHEKAKAPFTEEQLYAIDVLDSITNSVDFQCRYRMERGDFLITFDSQVLHGRTCFSDSLEAVDLPTYFALKNETKANPPLLKRTMERLWIKV